MPDLPALLYKGSVKDVHGIEGNDPYVFRFSDRYSVFDWGEMPDEIPGKGEALACLGDLFFKLLENRESWLNWQPSANFSSSFLQSILQSKEFFELKNRGLKHHSFGLVDDRQQKVNFGTPSKNLAVKAIQRILPISSKESGKVVWDYSAYEAKPQRALVPLEVVFRFGAPEGSSFLKRAEEIPGYAASLGFSKIPKAGEYFSHPIVEFFTKLEPTDRYLSKEEASKIACLNAAELKALENLTLLVAMRIKSYFAEAQLDLWDGKFEFSFLPGESSEQRDFQLVDSIGPDELRLMASDNIHFSKEILRRVYRPTKWYQAVEEAKKIALARGEKDWKKICSLELKAVPEKLSRDILHTIANIYPALVNAISEKQFQKKIYLSCPSLQELTSSLRGIA